MKKKASVFYFTLFACLFFNYGCTQDINIIEDSRIINYRVDLSKQEIRFVLKDSLGDNYGSLKQVKLTLEKQNKDLVLAMNGGMYMKDHSPQGLYIEGSNTISPLDTVKVGYGNFYLQPNGIFYLTKNNTPFVRQIEDYKESTDINFATQSGPMLVINDGIHPKFTKGSSNLNIRNGVGILENGDVLFAISKEKINLYDFATFFKTNGCKNALYLDGFVSKAYIPSKNTNQLEGNFGVIIAVTNKN